MHPTRTSERRAPSQEARRRGTAPDRFRFRSARLLHSLLVFRRASVTSKVCVVVSSACALVRTARVPVFERRHDRAHSTLKRNTFVTLGEGSADASPNA